MMKPTILITGAHGQVAYELCQTLAQPPQKIFSYPKAQLDITQPAQLAAAFEAVRPDIVINTAAYTQVDKAEQASALAFAVNRDGAKRLAELCEKYEAILIHLSTDYVFDGEKQIPYVETEAVNPLSVYGQSKWEGEEAIRASLTRHLIIRVSAVFGIHGHNFVKTIHRLTSERKHLRIVQDQITCPTPAREIARMLGDLCSKIQNTAQWGTYHFCATPAVSWYEFAQNFSKDIEPIPSSAYPTAAKRPRYSVLDCQKIKKIYNIQQPDWHMGLRDVIQQLSAS